MYSPNNTLNTSSQYANNTRSLPSLYNSKQRNMAAQQFMKNSKMTPEESFIPCNYQLSMPITCGGITNGYRSGGNSAPY